MSDEHLWAVLGYLRWYAPDLRALFGRAERAEGVPMNMWLEAQPIWGAIACELVRRNLIADPGQAMERLLASGSVPWELADAQG